MTLKTLERKAAKLARGRAIDPETLAGCIMARELFWRHWEATQQSPPSPSRFAEPTRSEIFPPGEPITAAALADMLADYPAGFERELRRRARAGGREQDHSYDVRPLFLRGTGENPDDPFHGDVGWDYTLQMDRPGADFGEWAPRNRADVQADLATIAGRIEAGMRGEVALVSFTAAGADLARELAESNESRRT
jgi:hypothetical protein